MNSMGPCAQKLGVRCPSCGSRTALRPNPHFGIGLAVHRYLRVCVACDWITIIQERGTTLPARANAVEVDAEDVKPARDRRGFRKRGRKRGSE
jgi:hypothetical protein